MPTKKPAARLAKPAPRRQTAPTQPSSPPTKRETVIAMLRRPAGATIANIADITQWQPHSVRGFLSGTVKKKLGLALLADKVDGVTRYRLAKGS